MGKKGKAKGNQQKPAKRKSFNKDYGRGPSGGSTPAFSMRDEVLNTERHHTEWSPAVRLRDQAIKFVSAGHMQPLEEPQTVLSQADDDTLARHVGSKEQSTASITLRDVLKQSEGALAHMSIGEQHPSKEEGDELMAGAMDTSPALKSTLVELDPNADLFVVDTIGDQSIVPSGLPAVQGRRTPPKGESDEEEVIVFRGRRGRVVDDPATSNKLGHDAPTHSDSFRQPLQMVDRTDISATVAAVDIPLTVQMAQTTGSNSGGDKQLPSVQATDRDGRRMVKGTNAAAAMLQHATAKPSGKKKGKSRTWTALPERRLPRDLDEQDVVDHDDAIYQDFIANASGLEDMLAKSSSDEWVSSDMEGVEEREIEMAIDASLINGRTQKADDSSGMPSTSLLTTDAETTDASALQSMWEDDDGEEAEDDEDEDDEGTSDPGDDSDLESELEYTLQERWEDEGDLRQRQLDALTDEDIARILAKQEDLGLGSDEILLLDDSGFGAGDLARAESGLEAILANSNRATRRKSGKGGKGKRSDHFPSASLMADVLDEDPYGGFDVMNFDRPSLRNTGRKKGRKSAGPLPEELLGLSDEELIGDLQSAWANDRYKKAAKKQEREELRREGLLGKGSSSRHPDLALKFAEGLSLAQLRIELEDFLDDGTLQQRAFPPMEKRERKLLHEIALVLDMTSTSRGSGRNRFTVLSKRARTPEAVETWRWTRIERIASRGFLKGTGGKGNRFQREGGVSDRAGRGGGFSKAAVGYANGEIVGAAAPEISEGNFGRRLMEKMGWAKGMALGKEGEGMLLPVEARVKSGRGGLG